MRSRAEAAVAGGCALGIASRLIDFVAPKWLGNVAAFWFVAGFLAGRTTRSARAGARRGTICLVVGTFAYYGIRLALDPITVGDLVPVPMMWLVAGIASGAVSGALGACSHRIPSSWGAPAGVFIGEALLVLALRGRVAQAALELACAAVCLRAARPSVARSVALAGACAPVVIGLGGLYRIVLR